MSVLSHSTVCFALLTGQLQVNDITEEGRDDPYDGDNFFRVKLTMLPAP
jgi:hypothetical protein